ncbi:hypothetical protein DFJ43DRAFT_1091885 [Lentinula guzmanii]|uniref:Uncharacterized protein n=1 Tax=Lentinula guzmanii TaxID=2804957 RepID=A0AA38MWS9_9AGAR|nr:hypothetical protein DFJ43DRAFT_1091885 [Lentinula guzmanii]
MLLPAQVSFGLICIVTTMYIAVHFSITAYLILASLPSAFDWNFTPSVLPAFRFSPTQRMEMTERAISMHWQPKHGFHLTLTLDSAVAFLSGVHKLSGSDIYATPRPHLRNAMQLRRDHFLALLDPDVTVRTSNTQGSRSETVKSLKLPQT